jgi:hypothetical protein
MIYWARLRNGTVTLSAGEHHAIRWCAAEALDELQPPIEPAIKWYCLASLAEVS